MKPRSDTRRKAKPARRREEAKELFRNAILEAAEQVFAEKGFHEAKIQEIAARARIGVGTVYNHFADKEKVLEALMDLQSLEMARLLSAASGEPAKFTARLTARVRRMLEYVEIHRGFAWQAMGFGGISAPGPLAAISRKIERIRSVLRKLVEEGIEEGVIEDRDPAHIAAFLGGSIRAFMLDALQDQRPLAPHAEEIVHLFLHGAGRR